MAFLLIRKYCNLSSSFQRCRYISHTGKSEYKDLISMQPKDFINYMKDNGLRRCSVVFDRDALQPVGSHDAIGKLSAFCHDDKHDYLNHEGMFLQIGPRSGALMGAFVWRTNRGQSCGGIRLWEYDSMEEYIKDGLRLSYGMGLKSALAGLWAGGGKGVIASPGAEYIQDKSFRKKMFLDYGELLSSLNGCYVAAEDAGVVVEDLNNVHSMTRFTTCISEDKGGSGNPSIETGKGVVCAMEAALDYLHMGDISGKSVVSQGCGNVARVIIDTLLDKNVDSIYASDCNEQALELAEKLFAHKSNGRLKLQHVAVAETVTLGQKCDILSPNALGNILRPDTIPDIKAKIVCGAANNQLGKLEDNKLLEDRGITYIVDFLCNRMGIVNCANEAYGKLHNDPYHLQHFSKDWDHSIWNVTHKVLRVAEERGITPVEAAMEIAEHESREWHPIWPRRNHQIISDLVQSNWAEL